MLFIYVMYEVYDQHKVYGRSSFFINTVQVHSTVCLEYILFLLGLVILQKSPPKLIQSRDHHVSERGKYTLPIHIFIYIDNKYILQNLFLTLVCRQVLYELVQSYRSTPCTYRQLSVTIQYILNIQDIRTTFFLWDIIFEVKDKLTRLNKQQVASLPLPVFLLCKCVCPCLCLLPHCCCAGTPFVAGTLLGSLLLQIFFVKSQICKFLGSFRNCKSANF